MQDCTSTEIVAGRKTEKSTKYISDFNLIGGVIRRIAVPFKIILSNDTQSNSEWHSPH